MSDSEFEEFDEPEEPEIVGEDSGVGASEGEVGREGVRDDKPIKGESEANDAQISKEKVNETIETVEKKDIKEKMEVSKNELEVKEDLQIKENKKSDPNEKSEIKEEKKTISTPNKEDELNAKENPKKDQQPPEKNKKILKTPEKKQPRVEMSSGQKPKSTFHPISQDSDINPSSKLSESFTMIQAESRGDPQSGIDLKEDCKNLISPNNQLEKQDEVQKNKETTSLDNQKMESKEAKAKDERENVQVITKKKREFKLLDEWVKNGNISSMNNGKSKEVQKKIMMIMEKNKRKRANKARAIGTQKSVLSKLKKLKIFKKLGKMKEEIQNNSCKEMKGLSKMESELLNEFLDSLSCLPDAVNKELFEN